MSIEDSNPERRNLVVLSMAIIAFYVGGCEIPSTGEIEMPLIKLKFTDAYHLAWLVWITLGWFAFRYWIENRDSMRDEFYRDVSGTSFLDKIFRRYFFNKMSEKDRRHIGSNKINWSRSTGFFGVYFFYEEKVSARNTTDAVHASPLLNWIILLLLTLRIFLIRPSVSANFGPILLFLIAVGLGIYNIFQ